MPEACWNRDSWLTLSYAIQIFLGQFGEKISIPKGNILHWKEKLSPEKLWQPISGVGACISLTKNKTCVWICFPKKGWLRLHIGRQGANGQWGERRCRVNRSGDTLSLRRPDDYGSGEQACLSFINAINFSITFYSFLRIFV